MNEYTRARVVTFLNKYVYGGGYDLVIINNVITVKGNPISDKEAVEKLHNCARNLQEQLSELSRFLKPIDVEEPFIPTGWSVDS